MRRCSEGHAIPADAPEGLCPLCLVSLAAPPSVPTHIGPYQLLEPLGEGGFGRVYRARRAGLAHHVALKLLRHVETMFVLAPDGLPRARSSRKSAEYLARSFAFRDYFKRAQAVARERCVEGAPHGPSTISSLAFVARAHLSESDGRFEFAISTPLCRGSTWLGVLAGTIASDKVLGAVRVLDDRHGRVAAVLGPRDRDRAAADLPLPSDLSFIVHPGLQKGQQAKLLHPNPGVIRAALGLSLDMNTREGPDRLRYAAPFRVDDYRDPVRGYEGAWSAVFASADDSGYIVAVASRRDQTPLTRALLDKLALHASIPLAFAVSGLVLLAIARRRRGAR